MQGWLTFNFHLTEHDEAQQSIRDDTREAFAVAACGLRIFAKCGRHCPPEEATAKNCKHFALWVMMIQGQGSDSPITYTCHSIDQENNSCIPPLQRYH